MDIVYIPFEKSSFRVGRREDNDFVFKESFVSREHFHIVRIFEGFSGRLTVWGRNGVMLNGNKVECGQSAILKEGDYISLGNKVFIFAGVPEYEGCFVPSLGPEKSYTPKSVEIEAPPPRKAPDKPSAVLAAAPALTMALPIVLGCGRAVSALTSIIAALWASGNVLMRHRKQKNEERRRKTLYYKYIDEIKIKIEKEIAENEEYLRDIYPPVSKYFKNGGNREILWNLFGRNSEDIYIRTGIGLRVPDFEIQVPRDRMSVVDDSLRLLPFSLKDTLNVLQNVPVCVRLKETSLFGAVIDDEKGTEYINAFLMQFAVSMPPERLSIVYLGNTGDTDSLCALFPFMAHLPQFAGMYDFSDCPVRIVESSVCLIVTRAVEMADISRFLNNMKEDGLKRVVLSVVDAMEELAPEFECVSYKENVKIDSLPAATAVDFAVRLRNLWVKSEKVSGGIPEIVAFDRLLKRGGFDFITPCYEDENTDTSISIRFPIGAGPGDSITYLDLHERGDGPHGLVAGTTGSGKSELITSVILSASMIYPPDKIVFFLIDYKGGGMANSFRNLPHLAGAMTNLSDGDLRRIRISLQSENLRRQKLFEEAGVNNISEYIRVGAGSDGRINLPHLVIIVDEFAELRNKHPEFMESLISIARIGRSLGIHLILSTQKPAGVVDDKIRSNTKFRIALRMEDASDSNDVIGSSTAAQISRCGRGIIRSGAARSAEFFQSAYAMGAFCEDNEDLPRLFSDPYLRCEYKDNVRAHNMDAGISCFDVCIDAIMRMCEERGGIRAESLCCKRLPENVSAPDGVYAVADNPYEHSYLDLEYLPEADGHAVVIGPYGSGTDELIRSMCFSAINKEEKCFLYVADFGEGRLLDFEGLCCCGGAVTPQRADDADKMILFLLDMLNERKRRGSYENSIIIAVCNFGEFVKTLGEEKRQMLEELLTYGKNLGIFLVVSAFDVSSSQLPVRLFEKFTVSFTLDVQDVYKVSNVLRCRPPDVFSIQTEYGRGLTVHREKVLEFVTIPVTTEKIMKLTYDTATLANAPPFPYIPGHLTLEKLLEASLSEGGVRDFSAIPVGYVAESGRVYYLPICKLKFVLINGSSEQKRKTFLDNISLVLARYEVKHFYAYSYETFCSVVNSNKNRERLAMLLPDFGKTVSEAYENNLNREEEDYLISLMDNSSSVYSGITIIALASDDLRSRLSGMKLFDSIIGKAYGINLGGDILSQRLFDFSYIPYSAMTQKRGNCSAMVLRYDSRMFFGEIIVPEEITGDVDNSERPVNSGLITYDIDRDN